jgi:acetyl-CoA carboxylase biotin carboxyl carrier protein
MKEDIFIDQQENNILDLLDKILELYKKNNLEEFELKIKDFEIKISSKQEIDPNWLKLVNINPNLLTSIPINIDSVNMNIEQEKIQTELTEEDNKLQKNQEDDISQYTKIIKAPLSGNFYTNISGNELINLGKNVKKGDVVCVIEAMKVMNEVNSDFDGVVKKIIPNNGDFVKEGDILIILE